MRSEAVHTARTLNVDVEMQKIVDLYGGLWDNSQLRYERVPQYSPEDGSARGCWRHMVRRLYAIGTALAALTRRGTPAVTSALESD